MANENIVGSSPTQVQKIYRAICNVIADVGAVGKDKQNTQQNYKYRAIDDVYNALNPALAKNGVVIFPNILEVEKVEKTSKSGTVMVFTTVKVEYTFYCAEDGSSIKAIFYGEGSDTGDKSINKAMSAAMKYACFQVFCIPTENLNDDADGHTPEEIGAKQKTKPKQDKPKEESYCCEDCGTAFEPCEYNGVSLSAREAYNLAIRNRKRPICKACHDKEKTASHEYITEAQRKSLLAKADTHIIEMVIEQFGYGNIAEIKKKDFDKILKCIVDDTLEMQYGEGLPPYDERLPWNMGDIGEDIPA